MTPLILLLLLLAAMAVSAENGLFAEALAAASATSPHTQTVVSSVQQLRAALVNNTVTDIIISNDLEITDESWPREPGGPAPVKRSVLVAGPAGLPRAAWPLINFNYVSS